MRDEQNPLSYRQRDERCEGVYVEFVANTTLVLASLTGVYQAYDHTLSDTLHITWPTFGEATTRLRAKGIKWKLYYRMDAVRPAGESAFSWPTNVLNALNITKPDMGVTGWTNVRLGETERRVYLPLDIFHTEIAERTTGYHLILLPTIPLSEVYVSVATVDAEGMSEDFLQDGKPLNYGYYPAHRPIDIGLSGFAEAGLYNVEIGASLPKGGATSLTFLLYHQPR